jgi:uroporphyrinogen decarboxylase
MSSIVPHKARLRAALAGEATDRPPRALWWHDFAREWSAAGLAEATLEAYRHYDWDLIKLNPRATYYYEAWGSRYEPTGVSQPRLVQPALREITELADLSEPDPTDGPFAEQLDALRRVVMAVGDEVDVIQTVFNPLTVAAGLLAMRPPAFREAAGRDPATVHAGLAHIARVLTGYTAACIEAGASGIFFATVDWATTDAADANFYREYGRPYDLQVLAAARGAPVNVLHVCRDRNLLDLVLDYPVQAFNWDSHGAGNPALRSVRPPSGAAVMGGVDRALLRDSIPEAVAAQVRESVTETDGRLVLAAGCAVDPAAPDVNLEAFAAASRMG